MEKCESLIQIGSLASIAIVAWELDQIEFFAISADIPHEELNLGDLLNGK